MTVVRYLLRTAFPPVSFDVSVSCGYQSVIMAVIFEVLEALEAPTLLLRGSAAVLLVIFLSHLFRELADGFPYRDIPLVGKSRWELSNKKAKERFISSAHELIQQGFSQVRSV